MELNDVFVTSDLHFGHRKVSEVRGFESTDDHDRHLIERWQETVPKNATVFVLGDIAGRRDDHKHALNLLAGLNGVKYLISGNHDAAHPVHVEAFDVLPDYQYVFRSVQPFVQVRVNIPSGPGVPGLRRILMSHFPYAGTGGDGEGRTQDRWSQFRLPDMGQTLIHGHTHRADQRGHLSDDGTPQVHAGLDAWGMAPVSMRAVADLILELETSTTGRTR